MTQRPVLPETSKIVELLKLIAGEPTGSVPWSLESQPVKKQRTEKAPELGLGSLRETKISGQSFRQSIKTFFSKIPWAGKPHFATSGTQNPTGPVSIPITVTGERVPMSISASDFFKRIPWHEEKDFDTSVPNAPLMASSNQKPAAAAAPASSSSATAVAEPKVKHPTEELSADNLFSDFSV